LLPAGGLLIMGATDFGLMTLTNKIETATSKDATPNRVRTDRCT